MVFNKERLSALYDSPIKDFIVEDWEMKRLMYLHDKSVGQIYLGSYFVLSEIFQKY